MLWRIDGALGDTMADTGIETAEALCESGRRCEVVGREEDVTERTEGAAEREADVEVRSGNASFSDALDDNFMRLR